MSLTHFCQLSSYINVFSTFVFSNHISNVSLPQIPSSQKKLKLSLSQFQKFFWGYVVCLDHDDDDDDDDCSTVVSSVIVSTSFKLFMNKVKDYIYEDRATLQQLKKCFQVLHLDLFTRDHVSRNLMLMH
ncbi:hypothetical protein HanPSC8_Chr03g0132521 [Helianthus annuus]|nr:hypothetical protein HanHA89_Chr03g0124691 [Helianthus annuus]KAJ0945837.1 hypothetical protein HanPSC8_Chr03g0132521 [Helianthus annuus]